MSTEFTTQRGDEHTHLIVLSDGSDFAWRAVDLAAELASSDGLDLEVLEVVLLPGDVEATTDAIRRRFTQQTARRERVDARIGENLRVTALVQNGRIDETIAAEIDGRDDGSLIVMSSVGRGRSAALIGSVAEDLLRALHGPILLVGPQVDIESFDPSGRVLIAVDGSELSEQAIGVGLAWAIEHGSTPWLVQSLDQEFADADRGESAYLARTADDIYRRTEHRVEYEVLHHRHPAHAIADYASDTSVSLVVATTHGRSGTGRAALGSEAMSIVHRCPRPVLLTRPPVISD